MSGNDQSQSFFCTEASPAAMDRYWAEGWRHFGILFFRYTGAFHDGERFTVLPLRVDLERFAPTRSQKRVLAKNRDTEIRLRPSFVDSEKTELFLRHRRRFRRDAPTALDEFLSPNPASTPCRNVELCVYRGSTLLGVTFLDLGATATSAVYAIFDPAEAKRSLGILMILQSIEFSLRRGYHYYYPGYAYREPFTYDYKKHFTGLEYFDWAGRWLPYVKP
jgi:leucyl-tRNA---protein transferase